MHRLLICTPSYFLHGGVERILEALARHLPARGWEVVFGLAQGARFHDPERYRQAYPEIHAVPIDGTSGTTEGRRRGLRRVLEAVRPDVVLNARLYDVYPVTCEFKAQGRGRPYLATLVQVYEPEYLIEARRYAASIDLAITGGELTVAGLVHWSGLPADRVVSIPGGIAPPVTVTARDFGRVPLRLGYVGRLDQAQKRIRDLTEVLHQLAARGVPFEMTIVGSGPEEAWLRQRLSELHLEDRVQFRGWMATGDLYRQVYPELDLFVHPAQAEGAPIALAEALLHGVVPVVSEFTGCLTEGLFVHESNALLFPVGAPAAAARHVERLHHDRLLLQRLFEAAVASRARVRSPEAMADAWAEALDQTLARPALCDGHVPRLIGTPNGRLERWGLAPRWAETARRFLGRRARHDQPGGEWPHWSGQGSAEWFDDLAEFARQEEARHRPVAIS
jgi:glycosyltransferase involved in cell wall biosynthesis